MTAYEKNVKIKTGHKKASFKLQAEGVIKNLRKRGMDGIFCETSAQAVQEICRMVPGRIVVVNEELGY